jgi:hypothetical protein
LEERQACEVVILYAQPVKASNAHAWYDVNIFGYMFFLPMVFPVSTPNEANMSERSPSQVSSYGEKVISEQTISTSQSRSGLTKGTIRQASNALSGFHALADLVLALTHADKDGRVLVVPCVGKGLDLWDGHLKFVMLNATKHFTEVNGVIKRRRAWTVNSLLGCHPVQADPYNLLFVRSSF